MDDKILLIDKPKGITSFDVIRKLRNKLGIKKMGHSGTLDPLATGLMLIGVGEVTKKLSDLIGLPKTYIAEIQLGIKTSTGDLEGEVVEEKKVPKLSKKQIKEVLEKMKGDINLQVPAYSAIKKSGKPLYKYARRGEKVNIPTKSMYIIETKFINFENNIITVQFEVKSGTYIRSIAEELGKKLGTVATLANLRRIAIGNYKIEEATKLT